MSSTHVTYRKYRFVNTDYFPGTNGVGKRTSKTPGILRPIVQGKLCPTQQFCVTAVLVYKFTLDRSGSYTAYVEVQAW